MTLKVARHRIERAHCRVGRVRRPKTASAHLIVSRQIPRAGRKVKRGTRVTVWLKAKSTSVKTTAPTLTAPTTTTTTQTPTTPTALTLHVSLDPSFTQNPSNPLQVTYQVSASATASGTTQTVSSLPAGVLEFFSDGSLADTMNVGGTTTGGSVTVTYAAYGQHTTDVVYDSGTNSTTTGDVAEQILPPAPMLSGMPANIVTTATSMAGSVVRFTTPTVVSLPDDPVSTPTCSIRSGTTVAIGTATDTCSATDQFGQTGQASFQITVNAPAPQIGTEADIRIAPASPSGTDVTFTPPAAVNGFGTPLTVSCSIPSGTVVAIGTVQDDCDATDQWGDTASTTFSITVEPPAAEGLAFTAFDTSAAVSPECPGTGSVCGGQFAPPATLTIPMTAGNGPGGGDGSALDLWIAATGGYTSDPFPAGILTFTITPAPWAQNAIGTGSTDCSAIDNADPSSSSAAGCQIYFDQDGSYAITTSFASSDPLYASIASGPSVTVDVTGS